MPDSPDTKMRMNVARITRTAGQSVFLTINALLIISILHTIWKDKKKVHSRPNGKVHPTLIILAVAWLPLIVRGVFGVLQAAIWSVRLHLQYIFCFLTPHKLSYMNPENYDAGGFTPSFSAIEYCFGVLPEWLAYVLYPFE